MSVGPLVSPGDVLDGKYVVERTLGQGGMGLVVAARHVVLKTHVAIKLLLPQATRDPENLKRFHREARAAVRIRSPHVARVHDVGQLANGTPYMVMDLLVGRDLEALLGERGVLSPREAVGFVLQALAALEAAHSLGIIHRDLKLANLFLVEEREQAPVVKVLDFGIARDFDEGRDQKLTQTGDVMGSPAYMSPEQMIESRNADARSDIWSIGACLYELLTGVLPFNGKTLAELCKSAQRGAPPPPASLRPDVPSALSAIVLRCLEKDPTRRFGSASELARVLRAWESAPVAIAIAIDAATTLPAPDEATTTLPIDTTPRVAAVPRAATVPLVAATPRVARSQRVEPMPAVVRTPNLSAKHAWLAVIASVVVAAGLVGGAVAIAATRRRPAPPTAPVATQPAESGESARTVPKPGAPAPPNTPVTVPSAASSARRGSVGADGTSVARSARASGAAASSATSTPPVTPAPTPPASPSAFDPKEAF